MQFRRRNDIARFVDISVIIPVGDSWPQFEAALKTNQSFFRRNGLEVILLVQEEIQQESALQLADAYPAVNWKILLCNHHVHNYQYLLNTGLSYACFEFILVLSAHVTFLSDVIYQLRYMAWHYENSFMITTGYSCLMAERNALTGIGGFFGEADLSDAIKSTCHHLMHAGKKQMAVPEALTLSVKPELQTVNKLNNLQPEKDNLLFNWTIDKRETNIARVLSQFDTYSINDQDSFRKHYRLICLIQVRNEATHLPEVLMHLEQHCDGIILLDDGSEDGSFDRADSKKLLLKVRKNYKGYFDDLENRNFLLQLGYLFLADWYFFADADERFDDRHASPLDICQMEDVDTVSFHMVHLWDHPDTYLKGLPEGKNGLFRRYRMFRNLGYMQIESNREIHFAVVPYVRRRFDAPVLVLHGGIMNTLNRQRKYEQYSKADATGKKQGYHYEFLLAEHATVGQIKDINLPNKIPGQPTQYNHTGL